MVTHVNTDSAECPDHGVLTLMLALELSGSSNLDAAIEIQAYQLCEWVRGAFREAYQRLWLGKLGEPCRNWYWNA